MNLSEYIYDLPEEKIAKFPLKDRSSSKLLKYDQGRISHHSSKDIASLLPANSLLIFNNTRVIPARLFFSKSTGAQIEIFILEPAEGSQREVIMQSSGPVVWQCMIRNLRKWKNETLELEIDHSTTLKASLVNRDKLIVSFSWNNALSFADILEKCGKIPLPPYINREATDEDTFDYQTVYAQHRGAVAAPTAGLHFTRETFQTLLENGIQTDYLTLHVSAGTFQPIKSENVREHTMHQEEIILTMDNIKNIIYHTGPIIPVGTTSLRTLESTYWFGVKLMASREINFFIEKLYPYQKFISLPGRKEAFTAVLQWMREKQVSSITGATEIFIFPGYKFRACDGIVTNFHLPGSTLILLIAALIGGNWKKIYQDALDNNYRFLSYGDSSLLLP